MKRIITTSRVPIKSWTKDIEEGAIIQAENVANLPFVYKHVALMPDCHFGFGVPIGTVVALNNVISPSMVGSDSGCGMVSVKTSLRNINVKTLKKVMGKVREVVPVGFNHHKVENIERNTIAKKLVDKHYTDDVYIGKISKNEYSQKIKEIAAQLGTLGGG